MPPMRAQWHNLVNTNELVLVSLGIVGMSFPLITAPFHAGSGPHLIRFLGSIRAQIQMASRSVQPSLHRWSQRAPILYNGTPLSPSSFPLPMGDVDPI